MRVITATEKFDAAHMLPQHTGKCHNLHGHTWRVEFEVSMDDEMALPADGMLIDYGVFKEIVNHFDHAYLVPIDAPTDREDLQLGDYLYSRGSKIAYIRATETTAESLAKCLALSVLNKLQGRFSDVLLNTYTTIHCTVWETEKHSASYTWCAR